MKIHIDTYNKVKIEVGPVYSRIKTSLNREIVDAIDLECSYMQGGAEYTSAVRNMVWDGFAHLFSIRTFTFPTGLLYKVLNVLSKFNLLYELDKTYQLVTNTIDISNISENIKFRDYQLEALKECEKYERGIIKIPTAGGKTSIYSGLICQKKVPTFIFVHRKELLYQTQKRLKQDANIDAGIVGDNKTEFKDVTVGMLQTLATSLGIIKTKNVKTKLEINQFKQQLAKYSMIISDECHVLGAKTFYKVCKMFTNAIYRYGGSATPLHREDGNFLIEAAMGPIIYSKDISDLKEKHIADVRVFFINFRQHMLPKYISYKDAYDKAIVNNTERNKIVLNIIERFKDKKILIFVKNIRHGEILQELVPGSVFVHGTKKTKERVRILNEFNEGKKNIVISTNIWEQGIDIPSLEIVIDMRAEKSKVAYIQLIGRALRKTNVKTKALIFDIFDRGCRWFSTHAKCRVEIINEEFKESFYIESL